MEKMVDFGESDAMRYIHGKLRISQYNLIYRLLSICIQ